MDDKIETKQEHTADEFVKALNELCQEYGFALRPELGLKQQIDGTFTISVQLSVDKLSNEVTNAKNKKT